MTESRRQDRPPAPPPGSPGGSPGGKLGEFLRLAESSDGSTHQLTSEKGGSPARPSSDAPGRASPSTGSAPAASFVAGESPGESPGESRTGSSGFETLMGKIVVDRGLMTGEDLDLCRALLQESASTDAPKTLTDVLLANEFVTPRQLQRLRTEFEADRSSQKIPGYRIMRKLGSGAMATVFLARQLSLDRLVAIKVLPKKFSSNGKFIERFYKEGRAAARLNDPNVVGAYDVGQAGEHHYFVMEYVDGDTVYDRIVQKKRFSEAEAIEVVRQVASALKHAHERGFIHRDIKPKNIMISRSGTVKLADLGLARALSDKEAAEAESGRAYGTPYYISPEQIRGQVDIGPQADIYGLGATLYHMVTGRVPFEGKNPSEVMHRHLKSELVPPDHINSKLSAGLAQVVEMMMAKDPRERYQSTADLIVDLDLLRKGQPPYFAQSKLGVSSVAHVLNELKTAPAPTKSELPRVHNPAADRLMLILLASGLIVSVLVNLGLIVAVFSK